MKKILFVLFMALASYLRGLPQTNAGPAGNDFSVRGFHVDLRIQPMTMTALKRLAAQLHDQGINTLIMEWEATYPFDAHPVIQNRYAYTKEEIKEFIQYCHEMGIDVIPLQQCFGHVEYILRHYRYKDLREDTENYSQVCPMKAAGDSALFSALFKELASTHPSQYIHIGGDETYLLGHCPLCRKQAEKVGKSRLYIDYIRMLCEIVIRMGRRPLVWADIALKYPEAIRLLPKQTIFIDWNYGWDLDRFGNHQKLLESGYEIWGAASIRSHPDNYFLTDWNKHFQNIRDFIPTARKLGYKGMVMTSWSTSGQYSTVQESETDIVDLYAIRHVYPITGFNILISAYARALRSTAQLDVDKFITGYCSDRYGFDEEQSKRFQMALRSAPYEIEQGTVRSPKPMPVESLLDSVSAAYETLSALKPARNQEEFSQFLLMTAIRKQYIRYELAESFANSPTFTRADIPSVLQQLRDLMRESENLDKEFISLNKESYYPAVLKEENALRNAKLRILYAKLSGSKE